MKKLIIVVASISLSSSIVFAGSIGGLKAAKPTGTVRPGGTADIRLEKIPSARTTTPSQIQTVGKPGLSDSQGSVLSQNNDGLDLKKILSQVNPSGTNELSCGTGYSQAQLAVHQKAVNFGIINGDTCLTKFADGAKNDPESARVARVASNLVLAGVKTFESPSITDVNGDGKINVNDATLEQRASIDQAMAASIVLDGSAKDLDEGLEKISQLRENGCI